ncbi:MAG: DUF3303 domain-containing protein [Aureispira sp.]|nr:DUF3303 domain-containing protein [Aureispira sp.]
MKTYMIIEHFHQDKLKEIYDRFDKKGRLMPESVHYINSWIDEKVEVCYQVMEAESREKLLEWISNWEDVTDFEIIPVIDSAKARKIALSR